MIQQAELFDKIGNLPQRYFGEVLNFVGYLEHKAKQETDAENFTVDEDGKIHIAKEQWDEMVKNSRLTQSLSGILSGMGDVDLDEVRMERLAKHL